WEAVQQALKWDFISQSIAVAAAMVSRTRMMWSLLTCFVAITRKTRAILISVSCASHWPTCIGLGFNPAIDFFPEVLAAVQLWQFFPQTMNQNPNLSFADLAHNHPEGGALFFPSQL
ncbi:hypothetical protein N7512_007441, partial [Penicillium capsulatum]